MKNIEKSKEVQIIKIRREIVHLIPSLIYFSLNLDISDNLELDNSRPLFLSIP